MRIERIIAAIIWMLASLILPDAGLEEIERKGKINEQDRRIQEKSARAQRY